MKIEKFEDIRVWQKSREFALKIYKTMELNRDYGFRDQMQRAAVSIMNNIAEGFERKGDKEFERFLYIAKGSAGEVRSMLYLGQDLKYLSREKCEELKDLSISISKMLSGFIRALKKQ